MKTTILKSFDIFVIIATTSSSITLSLKRIGSMAMPISSGIAYGLTVSNKLKNEIVMQRYNNYKKQ